MIATSTATWTKSRNLFLPQSMSFQNIDPWTSSTSSGSTLACASSIYSGSDHVKEPTCSQYKQKQKTGVAILGSPAPDLETGSKFQNEVEGGAV